MPCYHPVSAWQLSSGQVSFVERGDVVKSLFLPCGGCVGCRLERSRQWAVRCVHEASLHESNCFITLTYDRESLPDGGSLDYSQFQRFMKRLRKAIAPRQVRFYMAGEYGSEADRPHFHALIFGYDFPDRTYLKKTGSGSVLYRSAQLESLWRYGFSSVGDMSFEAAAYVARYVMKKVTGHAATRHYERVDPDTGEVWSLRPEFNHMSLKPGIGAGWFDKFSSDVFPRDFVVLDGKKLAPPRYYSRRFAKENPQVFEDIAHRRELRGLSHPDDVTDERLSVRERVANAGMRFFKRELS